MLVLRRGRRWVTRGGSGDGVDVIDEDAGRAGGEWKGGGGRQEGPSVEW